MPARNAEMDAGPATPLRSRLFVLRNTAAVAPACASAAANSGPVISEYPWVTTSCSITGVSPQWTPKITNTCHSAPMISPPTAGLRSHAQFTALDGPRPTMGSAAPVGDSRSQAASAT
jgi:hypothetical protein